LSEEELLDDGDTSLDSAEEEEARSRPPIDAVRPIRDIPNQYVFRFEVGPAILAQLLEKLKKIPIKPLSKALDAPYPGFYQIFLKDEPKYIGKSSRPLGDRLREHFRKLSRRIGLEISEVGCKYAFVEDPSLVDVAEGALISFFSQHGFTAWNQTGFGSKVTGHGRGNQKISAWALQFPPNLDSPLFAGSERPLLLWNLVNQIREQSPLTFSVPRSHALRFKSAHPNPVSISPRELPFQEWVLLLEKLLKPGWKISRKGESWYIVEQ